MAFAIRAVQGTLREQDGSNIDTDVQCFEPIVGNIREIEFVNTTDVDIYVYINTGTDFSISARSMRIASGGALARDIAANKQQTSSFAYETPLIVCFRSVAGSGTTGGFWMHTLLGD